MQYFDIEGNPVEFDLESPEGMEMMVKLWNKEYRRVAQDYVGDIHVSTVFLPIDHGWGEGPPILFETMVFGYGDDEEAIWEGREWQWSYATKEEALVGHAKVLEAVRNRTLEEL